MVENQPAENQPTGSQPPENQPTGPLPQSAPPSGPLPQQPQAAQHPVEPFYKRHGLAFAISTLVLAVVVLFGAVGVGAFAIGSVLLHSSAAVSRVVHDEGPAAPSEPQLPGRPGDGGQQGGRGGDGQPFSSAVVRGTVTRISGDSWTVESRNGTRLTIETTSSTAYGVPGSSERASDFGEGDEIIVVGDRSGDTVTAARILKLDDFPLRPPSTPGGSTPGSSATPGS